MTITINSDGTLDIDPTQILSINPVDPQYNPTLATDQQGLERLIINDIASSIPDGAHIGVDARLKTIMLASLIPMTKAVGAAEDRRIKAPTSMSPYAVASLLALTGDYAVIVEDGSGHVPRIYRHITDRDYTSVNTDRIRRLEHLWQPVNDDLSHPSGYASTLFIHDISVYTSLTSKTVSEVYAYLSTMCPTRILTGGDPETEWLVPCMDGIRDASILPGEDGAWISWSDADDYTFTSKLHVWYHPEITNFDEPHITRDDGTDWCMTDEVKMLMSDPANPQPEDADKVSAVWWSIRYAVLHNVPWGRVFIYLNSTNYSHGNNGKSTMIALIRAMYDDKTMTPNISLDEFKDKDSRQMLDGACCVLSDEAPAGTSIAREGCKPFKLFATHDVMSFNPKYQLAYSSTVRASGIFATNEVPRFADKTDSLERRLKFIPFSRDFSDLLASGALKEDAKIKDDYIKRPEVLTFVLRRVLDAPEYYPVQSKLPVWSFDPAMVQSFRLAKTNTSTFLTEVLDSKYEGTMDKWANDICPIACLYAIYTAWCKSSQLTPCPKPLFHQDLERWVASSDEWYFKLNKRGEIAPKIKVPASYRAVEEPLMDEYKDSPDVRNQLAPVAFKNAQWAKCYPKALWTPGSPVYDAIVREATA